MKEVKERIRTHFFNKSDDHKEKTTVFTRKESDCNVCLHEGITGEASVLVIIFEKENVNNQKEVQLLFTQRSKKLKKHSGESCFPGGKKDETDANLVECALRESEEEMQLNRNSVYVLPDKWMERKDGVEEEIEKRKIVVYGSLKPYISKHLLLVTPIVAIANSSFSLDLLQASEFEVEKIFSLPLDTFLKAENHKHQEIEWLSQVFFMHFFEVPGYPVVWGLTAWIAIEVSLLVHNIVPQTRQPQQELEFQLMPSNGYLFKDLILKAGTILCLR